ncbi:unnamed protein product, partial [marine sediment metagenome]
LCHATAIMSQCAVARRRFSVPARRESGGGGNEAVEAFDGKGPLGIPRSGRPRARVNAEQASKLSMQEPTCGLMYELYVIAAVVVGTSLAGGQGRILGTLIGAFIIAVIQNGMNLTGVESYTQKVVLGAVILGAVLLDMLKKRRST